MSLREQILAADGLRRVRVDMPEWGVAVWVRVMSGAERAEYETAAAKVGKDVSAQYAHIVAATCCDETGARLFTETDVPELLKKGAPSLHRLALQAWELNRLDANAVETEVKN